MNIIPILFKVVIYIYNIIKEALIPFRDCNSEFILLAIKLLGGY